MVIRLDGELSADDLLALVADLQQGALARVPVRRRVPQRQDGEDVVGPVDARGRAAEPLLLVQHRGDGVAYERDPRLDVLGSGESDDACEHVASF